MKAWFDLGNGRMVYRRVPEPSPARSGLPTPYVATDCMDLTEHPCDGKFYDSKSAFRGVTKANGCIEVGNDPARLRRFAPPKPNKQEIRDTIKAAKQKVFGA